MLQKHASSIIAIYGILGIYLVTSGNIAYLVHPNYNLLVLACGIFLSLLGIFGYAIRNKHAPKRSVLHLAYVFLLLIPALVLFAIHPRPLSSNWNQSLEGNNASLLRSRGQAPVSTFSLNTENRSLADWINLLEGYGGNPDNYKGQKVKLTGFIVFPKELGPKYFQISRHFISCCAADAQILGLPVQYEPTATNTPIIKTDAWVEMKGTIDTQTISGEKSPVIILSEIKATNPPSNPYEF